MKVVRVRKGRKVEDALLIVDGTCNDRTTQDQYLQDAIVILDVLTNHVPSATLDRVLYGLLQEQIEEFDRRGQKDTANCYVDAQRAVFDQINGAHSSNPQSP